MCYNIFIVLTTCGGAAVIDEIVAGIYRIEVPLPRNPLKYINSYLVKGIERCLLVDTGLDRPECLEALRDGLAELNVDMSVTDIFITHMHADHSGLVGVLKNTGNRAYASAQDGYTINHFGREHWERLADCAKHNGFDPNLLEAAITRHPGFRGGNKEMIDFTFVSNGEVLDYGDFKFTCVLAPGHTAGHMCLYEANRHILFAGDNILNDITPNITAWRDNENPLANYQASLDKLEKLAINIVLPAHRTQINDWRARVAELKHHHELRLAEVEAILRQGELTAYQVAAKMSWDIRCNSFDEFPVPQKWFATGEALAHIRYLEEAGRIRRTVNEPVAAFTVV
jgi:glyoxylase-like metal-dependent hydrolase (beta-lactamase superfamily II)